MLHKQTALVLALIAFNALADVEVTSMSESFVVQTGEVAPTLLRTGLPPWLAKRDTHLAHSMGGNARIDTLVGTECD
jgi:hypothetical protein